MGDEEEDKENDDNYEEDKQVKLGKKSSMADPKTRPIAANNAPSFPFNPVCLVE